MVGRIDDILFACEHVLHWIYGVCLCFQITCCGCQIKVDTLVSWRCHTEESQMQKKLKRGWKDMRKEKLLLFSV